MTDSRPTAAAKTKGRPSPPPGPDFSRRLLAWYAKHRRRLPWREGLDPYRIWISEIMLQQTTVRAVVPYFERWLRLFPDMPSLARAPLPKVLRAWQGLGYYQRARNLHRAAAILVRDHGGRLPDDEKVLRRLPGFGPYTTAAVLSLAYGRPLPVVDANVRRVLMRILGVGGEASAAKDNILLAGLRPLIAAVREPGDFNQAMMELGALVCRSRNPLCPDCPAAGACRAEREGRQDRIPRPRKSAAEKIEAVVAVIEKDGRFLIQKWPPDGLFGGLWEFPGGKRKRGESREAALRREVLEETGARIRDIRFLATVKHAYTRFRVTLHVYRCRLGGRAPETGPERRWASLRSVRRYPLPAASVRIVEILAGGEAGGSGR